MTKPAYTPYWHMNIDGRGVAVGRLPQRKGVALYVYTVDDEGVHIMPLAWVTAKGRIGEARIESLCELLSALLRMQVEERKLGDFFGEKDAETVWN